MYKASPMPFVYNDGGRKAAGYKGSTGDCVARAVAIATEQPYSTVYDALSEGMGTQKRSKYYREKRRTAGQGIHVRRTWFRRYLESLGWRFVPIMKIGTGCTMHLRADEFPSKGRFIVSLSRHYVAVIDGVIHDLGDPQRQTLFFGTDGKVNRIADRCVYGYWERKPCA